MELVKKERLIGVYSRELERIVLVTMIDENVDVANVFKELVFNKVIENHEDIEILHLGFLEADTGEITNNSSDLLIRGSDFEWEEE